MHREQVKRTTVRGRTEVHIRHVNRMAEPFVKAFRAVARELTRQLPGRAQKGAVDAALRSVEPVIRKKLKP